MDLSVFPALTDPEKANSASQVILAAMEEHGFLPFILQAIQSNQDQQYVQPMLLTLVEMVKNKWTSDASFWPPELQNQLIASLFALYARDDCRSNVVASLRIIAGRSIPNFWAFFRAQEHLINYIPICSVFVEIGKMCMKQTHEFDTLFQEFFGRLIEEIKASQLNNEVACLVAQVMDVVGCDPSVLGNILPFANDEKAGPEIIKLLRHNHKIDALQAVLSLTPTTYRGQCQYLKYLHMCISEAKDSVPPDFLMGVLIQMVSMSEEDFSEMVDTPSLIHQYYCLDSMNMKAKRMICWMLLSTLLQNEALHQPIFQVLTSQSENESIFEGKLFLLACMAINCKEPNNFKPLLNLSKEQPLHILLGQMALAISICPMIDPVAGCMFATDLILTTNSPLTAVSSSALLCHCLLPELLIELPFPQLLSKLFAFSSELFDPIYMYAIHSIIDSGGEVTKNFAWETVSTTLSLAKAMPDPIDAEHCLDLVQDIVPKLVPDEEIANSLVGNCAELAGAFFNNSLLIVAAYMNVCPTPFPCFGFFITQIFSSPNLEYPSAIAAVCAPFVTKWNSMPDILNTISEFLIAMFRAGSSCPCLIYLSGLVLEAAKDVNAGLIEAAISSVKPPPNPNSVMAICFVIATTILLGNPVPLQPVVAEVIRETNWIGSSYSETKARFIVLVFCANALGAAGPPYLEAAVEMINTLMTIPREKTGMKSYQSLVMNCDEKEFVRQSCMQIAGALSPRSQQILSLFLNPQ